MKLFFTGALGPIALFDLIGEDWPVAVQIFGADPEKMGQGGKGSGGIWRGDHRYQHGLPDSEDCQEPGRLRPDAQNCRGQRAIIRAVVDAASPMPVTVKMRKGWSGGELVAPELARQRNKDGAAGVTVHGRSRDQFYSGTGGLEHYPCRQASGFHPGNRQR